MHSSDIQRLQQGIQAGRLTRRLAVQRLVAAAANLRMGDPADENTQMGPLISDTVQIQGSATVQAVVGGTPGSPSANGQLRGAPLREKIAVFTPISLPSKVISAPPELPGLIEASVWMKSS